MNKFYLFHVCRLFVAGLLLSVNHFPAWAQDDPNRDQLPEELRKLKPKQLDQTDAVITIGDFDNFKIGTDYAEVHLMANPMNPLQHFACWNASNSGGTQGWKSQDSYTWTVSNPAWGNNGWGDPVLAYDSLGHLYYENMYGSGGVQGCKVAMSSDNGVSWGSPVIAIAGSDKNWIAADQTAGPYSNYVYTTMTGTTSGQGKFYRSTDFGATWTNTVTFSNQSQPGMMVCVGPNGNIQGGSVYVVTHSGNTGSSVYTFHVSKDGGQTFTQKSSQNFANYVGTLVGGRNSVQNMRTRPYPFIAADNSYGPHRGRLYCIYASNMPAGSGNKPNIYSRYSDDDGATWSQAIIVNDDANTVNNHQWFPAIWCDKTTGKLWVQWMDTRDCPTSDSALIYATYSDDGGVTFKPNVAVSNEKMKINCSQCPGSGTPKYQGDYNGIITNWLGGMLAWTDFRDNAFDNYVAYFPDFGMRVTPAVDTLADTAVFNVMIPSVKYYTDTVFMSVTAADTSLHFIWPQGNKLWTYPGSLPVKVYGLGPVNAGNYTLNFRCTGTLGMPRHERTALLKVLAAPIGAFKANDTTVCQGQNVNFTDLSSGPPNSWEWKFQDGTPPTSTLQNPANIQFNTPGSHDVTLIVTNTFGSDTITKAGYIKSFASPNVDLGHDTTICITQILVLNATIPNAYSYIWSPTGLSTPTLTIDSTVVGLGPHNFFVTVTDINGCTDKDTIMVTFAPCTGFGELTHQMTVALYPNPTTGELNLAIQGTSEQAMTIRILNPLGAEIYREEDVRCTGRLSMKIDLNGFAEGLYLLKLENNNSVVSRAFMIRK